jgi:hypothetical protein
MAWKRVLGFLVSRIFVRLVSFVAVLRISLFPVSLRTIRGRRFFIGL